MDKKINILLNKYINNRLTPGEVSDLRKYIQDSGNEELDSYFSHLWDSYEVSGKASSVIRRKISRNLQRALQPRRGLSFAFSFGSIAVAACICLLVGFAAYLYIDREQTQKILSSEYTIQVGKGERATVLLPDGTKVYLNAQSGLSYPASFGQKERRVQFSGEAYFDVVTNKEKPFIVDNPLASVKVSGTVFNFYATTYDDWFETTLIEGRVEVTLNLSTPKTAVLTPNQKMRYNKRTGEWKIVSTDSWEETAWRRGDLIFRSKTFKEVVGLLENYYGVTISIEGNYPETLFTGTFHEDDINAVLLNLQQHYHLEYTKTGNEIHIKLNY